MAGISDGLSGFRTAAARPPARTAPPQRYRHCYARCPVPVPRSAPRVEYRRREPESTLLYRTVAAELDGLRAALAAKSPHGAGLPKHVDRELDAYLRCGILAHGFVRVACRWTSPESRTA
jgi:hypothetical protein